MGLSAAGRLRVYSKKTQYILLAMMMGLSSLLMVPVVSAAGVIAIDDCEELQLIGYDNAYPLDGSYELTGNIDCSDSENWDESDGFKPIGASYEDQFTGEFNGKGFVISDLYISRPYVENVGLFGRTNGATISDVHIRDSNIQGRDIVGSLVGLAENTTIQRVSVVSPGGSDGVAATGYDDEGSPIAVVGGLVGVLSGASTIRDAFVRTNFVSYYEGFARYGGGLVGYTIGANGSIKNTYTVPVLGGAFVDDTAGPLVGSLYYDTELSTSFWDSSVYGNNGGTETSGNYDNGRTTAWLKTQSNFVDAGWDFDSVWALDSSNDGYPHLRAPSNISSANATNDKNGDGIVDATQANVSSLTSTVSGKPVVLEVDDSCDVSELAMISAQDNAKQDAGYNYPQGLMDFTALCGTPGFTSTVTQYYYDVELGTLSLRKYNPATQQYSAITDANISQQTIYGQSVVAVSYQVTDGGPLDADGEANGTIVDPAGLASPLTPGAPSTGFYSRDATPVVTVGIAGAVLIIVLAVSRYVRRYNA